MKIVSVDWSSIFTNEAISNYVVFLAGITVGVFGWGLTRYLARKRPQMIEVVKVNEVSVLAVDSGVKSDIKIEYKGNMIESLYRTTYHILNRSCQLR